jgi:excisionase family DNA binding protein
MEEFKQNWLPINEAAAEYGFSPRYLRRLVQKGKIPAVKLADRWFVNRAVIEAYKRKMTRLGRKRFAPSKWWPKEEEQ